MNYNIVLNDNENNFYGIVKVENCKLKLDVVNLLIEDVIIELCGNDKNVFYERFSEIISDMLELLEKKIIELQNENCNVILGYDNCDIVNVDNFRFVDNVNNVTDKVNYDKKDLDCIVDTICDMLGNNESVDSMGELFEDWCENGNVFEENVDNKIYLMNKVKSKVNELSDLLLGLYNDVGGVKDEI